MTLRCTCSKSAATPLVTVVEESSIHSSEHQHDAMQRWRFYGRDNRRRHVLGDLAERIFRLGSSVIAPIATSRLSKREKPWRISLAGFGWLGHLPLLRPIVIL